MFKYQLVYEHDLKGDSWCTHEFKAKSDQEALQEIEKVRKAEKSPFFVRKLACVGNKGKERVIIQL